MEYFLFIKQSIYLFLKLNNKHYFLNNYFKKPEAIRRLSFRQKHLIFNIEPFYEKVIASSIVKALLI